MTFTKFETKGTIWLSNLDVHSYRDELHIWLLSCVNIIYVTLDNKTSHKGQLMTGNKYDFHWLRFVIGQYLGEIQLFENMESIGKKIK